ncbi:pimeloyl-ACP methyl ester carboxylesterase [Microbacterium foliorum]|uniref:Pimeloyl-ACP methyl ester carboxylesterase n=1 Tax=Microbacterium foliorum TaxID=104336 RepID=A0ABU1HVG4_9MICO|nr:alpha/beta hydrolase [Microbacterium foliorum]MDR6144043.1 pimeloyl-ACP methyl ester carboxylesterase [Microbacterium foliorum]
MVSIVLVTTACTPAASPPEGTAGAGLERFHEQQLDLEPCELPGFVPETAVAGECGHIEVPLNYEEPDGETAQIAVFRVPARGDSPIGSLVVNPGGPGFPGAGYAAQLADIWGDNALTERFDIVGFDPRGTGATVPALDCYTDAERDAGAGSASQLSYTGVRPLVEACAESVGGEHVLAHLGTRDVARDMDVMRAVLGDTELSFAGSSYGTRLGAVYAEMFPDNVRALVLDGALDPYATTLERREQQWTGFQAAFEQFAVFCAQQGSCAIGDDRAAAAAEYQRLTRPLVDSPIMTTSGRELTFADVSDALVTGLYSSETWPVMSQGLSELAQGDGTIMLGLRDFYLGRTPEGTYDNGTEATLAINCLDEDRFTPSELAELERTALDAAPFLDPGTPIRETSDLCEGWPVEPTLGFPYADGIRNLPPTLTVSVTGDPATPHVGGIRLAETLGGSLLTVDGDQHGALLAANDCVEAAVTAYLIDLEAPPRDAECTLAEANG